MTLSKLAILAALLVTNSVAHAATVITVSGPDPFGFGNQLALAQGWSQSVTYQNVTIVMPLADETNGGPINGVEGTVYLMNQVGPGTTSANEVVPPITISGLSATFVDRTLFSGLTLPAGTYYIVLSSTSTGLSMSPRGSSSATATTGNGVIQGGGGANGAPAPYPPASDFALSSPENYLMTVTGDEVANPVLTPQIGLWWNPNESGTGYAIDYKHGVIVMTVYSYTETGLPQWYLAFGPLAGDTWTGTLYKYTGGQCISCAYQPELDNGSNDGTVTVVFSSPISGTMYLPGGRVTQIQPQAF